MPAVQSKPTNHSWPFSFMFLVVCCASLLLAVVAVSQSYREIRHEIKDESAESKSSAANETATSADSLKDLFENLKDRTDNLQKLITTLIALSSLYAIVLTVTGYLNVQKVLLEARTSLEEVDAIKQSLGNEYASLTHIGENLEKITRDLREQLPNVQELSDSFQELTPEDHQKIYFQEKAISFAQLVVPDTDADIGERLSGAFVALSRFYRGLYLSNLRSLEKKAKVAQIPVMEEERTPNLPLRERALFYAKQATLQSATNFIAQNEFGNCLLEFGPAMTDEALKHFRASLKCNRNQQMARFAISSILHRRGEYKRAEELLTEAIGLDLWETTRESARRSDLYYNRACAYSKLAEQKAPESSAATALLDLAIGDLRLANITRSEVSRSTYAGDTETGGDLSLLAESSIYAQILRQLL